MFRFVATLTLLCAAGLAHAAVFTVTSTADDGSPGTLRWALEQHAADTSSPNTIEFDASLAGQVIQFADTSPSGNFPPINAGTLTIDGSAAAGLAIDRSGGGRIFIINNQAEVTLRNLTLQNADGLSGGGCVRSAGHEITLRIERVTFEDCQQRSSGADAFGGAIYVDFTASGGSLRIADSRFVSNRVYGTSDEIKGGAIYVRNRSVTIERSVFELNSAEDTGSAFELGGAVFVRDADVELRDNEFLFNQVSAAGNASGAGGAVALNLRPTNDAFVIGNLFAANVGRLGAGIWTGTQITSGAPFFNFTQNTFLANTSDSSTGGALFVREGDVILRNNAFIDNTNLRTVGGAAHLAYNPGGTSFSAIWNNLFGPASTDACATTDGTTASYPSVGFNVMPDTSCNLPFGFPSTNQLGDAGPFLALGDYGGQTRVVPPAAGNLAIDNGNPAAFTSGDVSKCPEFDVRGQLRPGDGDADGTAECDVGPFEWAGEAPLFRDSFEPGLAIP